MSLKQPTDSTPLGRIFAEENGENSDLHHHGIRPQKDRSSPVRFKNYLQDLCFCENRPEMEEIPCRHHWRNVLGLSWKIVFNIPYHPWDGYIYRSMDRYFWQISRFFVAVPPMDPSWVVHNPAKKIITWKT